MMNPTHRNPSDLLALVQAWLPSARDPFALRRSRELALRPSLREACDSPAERELALVHAAELSYLLREASRLRFEREPAAAEFAWLAPAAQCRAVWISAFDEALALLAADRLELPCELGPLAASCRADPIERWPDSLELAAAGLALSPDDEGRRQFALALLAGGDESGAACLARAAQGSLASKRARLAWTGLLAAACEARGAALEAFECYLEFASAGGESASEASARAFQLALGLEDAQRVARALRSLGEFANASESNVDARRALALLGESAAREFASRVRNRPRFERAIARRVAESKSRGRSAAGASS